MSLNSIHTFLHGTATYCVPNQPMTIGQIISNLFSFAIIYNVLTTLLTFVKKYDMYNTEKKIVTVLLLIIHGLAGYVLIAHSDRCDSFTGIIKALVITVLCVILLNNILTKQGNLRTEKNNATQA